MVTILPCKNQNISHKPAKQLIFTAPLILILYLSINDSFINPTVKNSGVTASYPLYAIFLTANKSNSVLTFVLGISFDRLIKWHQVWSILAVVSASFHCYAAYTLGEDISLKAVATDDVFVPESNERMLGSGSGSGSGSGDGNYSIHALNGEEPNFIQYCFDNSHNFTGTMALLCMAALVLPSVASILRRWFYELWYIPHILLALAVGIFLILHGIVELSVFLGIWALDLFVRYAIMAGRLYPHDASIRALPGDIVEISFPKPDDGSFEYDAGQFVMIAIPKIAFSQFHPFSISSSPNDDVVTLHIKAVGPDTDSGASGSWTRRVLNLAKSGVDKVNFMMEGPYGNLAVELFNKDKYKMVLMISGGIGVTPMQSIANQLLNETKRINIKASDVEASMSKELTSLDQNDLETDSEDSSNPTNLKKIKFIWASKSMDTVKAMKDSATHHTESTGISIYDYVNEHDILDMDIFITGPEVQTDSNEASSMTNHMKISHSRPFIDSIFQEMKEAAIENGESSVAVVVCGPVGLSHICKVASCRWSDPVHLCKTDGENSVKFDFHDVKFAF